MLCYTDGIYNKTYLYINITEHPAKKDLIGSTHKVEFVRKSLFLTLWHVPNICEKSKEI